jgi:hypothetical protein
MIFGSPSPGFTSTRSSTSQRWDSITDLYQAAVNFTARTGAGLEIEHARHVYACFVKNNMEMKMALEQEQNEDKRGIHL